MPLIEELNQSFAIAGQLSFVAGKGGFPMIEISSEQASATISLYGGQVLSYQPAGQEELLFVSDAAYYREGKAIKGGIPICWPWFGDDPEHKGRGAHGFVRNRLWQMVGGEVMPDGAVRVVLGLMDGGDTQHIWLYEFDLTLEITVGATLSLALVTRNADNSSFPLTQAFHTYFAIGDIHQLEVLGLEDCPYLDKADAWKEKIQTGPVTVDREVDRVYQKVKPELVIEDPVLKRRIHIQSQGNKTAVVWNPWIEIAQQMGDLKDDDYLRFICVETTNAADDVIDMAPGGEFRLAVEYSIYSN